MVKLNIKKPAYQVDGSEFFLYLKHTKNKEVWRDCFFRIFYSSSL